MNDTPDNDKTHEISQDELRADFEKLLMTPLSKDELDIVYADTDVERAQLLAARNELSTQILQMQLQLAGIDARLRIVDVKRAVASRRVLNKPADKAEEPNA